MQFDLRKPVLVVTGNWNPAIFQPAWLAQHLYDVPHGEEVSALVAELSEGSNKIKDIIFIKKIGFAANLFRIEFFQTEDSKDHFSKIEEIATKLVKILPHTPLAGIGYNFLFSESDPEDSLIDKLKSADRIDLKYKIKSRDFKNVIAYGKNADLNLAITVSKEAVYFNFNYHHRIQPNTEFDKLFHDGILSCKKHALRLLKDIYDLEGYDVIGFNKEAKE